MPVAGTQSLAGLPLSYLIGADDWPGQDGRVIVVGYDADKPPSAGIGVAYCNLRVENGEPEQYAPYLPHDDIWRDYKEGKPDPSKPGFDKNLKQQFGRRQAFGFQYIELDNLDSYDLATCMRVIALAEGYSLKVVAKNVLNLKGGAQILAHPNVVGCIVEAGAGSPVEMHDLRRRADKPALPVWFVFHTDQLVDARITARAIEVRQLVNMGVTHSPDGEYTSIQDILLPIKEQPMAWRLAKSLEVLRDQVNARWPGRDKSSDGTIGDAEHQKRQSDHNPNEAGAVTAMDITHDPAHGLDARKLAEVLVASRDNRIKYIISNAEIVSRDVSPWTWRPYTGSNPHRAHVHISVSGDPWLYNDERPWSLNGAAPAPVPGRHMGITATVFGGLGDPNLSAYDEHFITDGELGCSLPYRFKGKRPKVRVFRAGKVVEADIVDVGPWNTDDPYWESGGRPQAESGTDKQGRKTNLAGIDLTPAAARTIDLPGKGLVDWEFVVAAPVHKPLEPIKSDLEKCLAEIITAIRPILEKHMVDAPASEPIKNVPALDDETRRQIALAVQAAIKQAAPKVVPVVWPWIQKMLPSLGIVGSIAGMFLTSWMQTKGWLGPATGDAATPAAVGIYGAGFTTLAAAAVGWINQLISGFAKK